MLVDLKGESSSAVREQTLQLIKQALHAVRTTPLLRNLRVHQWGFVIKENIFNLFCGGAYRFFFSPFLSKAYCCEPAASTQRVQGQDWSV